MESKNDQIPKGISLLLNVKEKEVNKKKIYQQ
jgi:hypothetical protein